MTEDQNEQTTGQEPVSDPSPTAATPAAEGTGAAIPMPAASATEPDVTAAPAAEGTSATTPTPAESTPQPADAMTPPPTDAAPTAPGAPYHYDVTTPPQQPDTPPQGVPHGRRPAGYAMGALGGQPDARYDASAVLRRSADRPPRPVLARARGRQRLRWQR